MASSVVKAVRKKGCLILLVIGVCAVSSSHAADTPVIDSAMTRSEALARVDRRCPPDVLDNQEIITLTYYSFDGQLHEGQLVIDRHLAEDVREVFALARALKFPIGSVIPLSDERFLQDGRWSDERSMRANNTSGFNYRLATGSRELSRHAAGHALDINPFQNPYVRADTVEPAGAVYDPDAPGTLYAGHPVVEAFLARGWSWGGNWKALKDYQHFEKTP